MNRRALKLHNTIAYIIVLNYSVTKVILQILQFFLEKEKKNSSKWLCIWWASWVSEPLLHDSGSQRANN